MSLAVEQIKGHIRWMIRRDMPEVLEIENHSFEMPWNEEDFLKYLRQRSCIGMVIEVENKIIGYMIYELHKTKLHILNFAVHNRWRERGIGTQLINKLKSKLSAHRRTTIDFHIRETNLDMQLFLKAMNFQAINVRRQYYDDTNEDAYIFRYVTKDTSPI